jgi:hypothetical protein
VTVSRFQLEINGEVRYDRQVSYETLLFALSQFAYRMGRAAVFSSDMLASETHLLLREFLQALLTGNAVFSNTPRVMPIKPDRSRLTITER